MKTSLKGYLVSCAFIGALLLLLSGCPQNTLPCGTGQDIEIATVTPVIGQNQRAVELTITGGCFNGDTDVFLENDAAGLVSLAVLSVPDTSRIIAQTPAGLPVGRYALRVRRGTQEAVLANGYKAVANIVVSGEYEGKFFVVDMSDVQHPREIRAVQPWPGDYSRLVYTPDVNHDGTRVYFEDYIDEASSGIYGADLADGGGLERITDRSVPYYHDPAASPSEPLIACLGAREVPDVCDIYIVREDGSGQEMIADHEETVLINGDDTGSWGLWDPVFSPDGSKIAFLRETVCAGCTNDWYSVVMTMNKDGSGKRVVYWEEQVRFYDNLRWTGNNYLMWNRRDDDLSPVNVVALDMDTMELTTVLPPETEWPDFVYFTCAPHQNGLLMQPFNTSDMVYYALNGTSAPFSAAPGNLLEIPDPDAPGEAYHHYNSMDWFYWSE